jgi:hypothetical protein
MDEGTFLENYLMSLETLPNDVRRDFELVTAPLVSPTFHSFALNYFHNKSTTS